MAKPSRRRSGFTRPRFRGAFASLIGLGAALASGAAFAAADADHGEKLARRWCAACHIVASDQAHGQDSAPPFATIAKMPGFTAANIAMFLRDPHPKMPDMQLSRPETEDLAAYIVSLSQ